MIRYEGGNKVGSGGGDGGEVSPQRSHRVLGEDLLVGQEVTGCDQ